MSLPLWLKDDDLLKQALTPQPKRANYVEVDSDMVKPTPGYKIISAGGKGKVADIEATQPLTVSGNTRQSPLPEIPSSPTPQFSLSPEDANIDRKPADDGSDKTGGMNDALLAAAIMGTSTLLGQGFGGTQGGAIGAKAGAEGNQTIIKARTDAEALSTKMKSMDAEYKHKKELKQMDNTIELMKELGKNEMAKQLEDYKAQRMKEIENIKQEGGYKKQGLVNDGGKERSTIAADAQIEAAKIRAAAQKATSGANKPMTPYQSERLKMAQDNKLDRDTQQLSSRIEKSGISDTLNIFKNVEGLIPGGIDGWKGQDIPGYGQTRLVPGPLLSQNGQRLRQEVSAFRNALLKIRSGTAVTDNELKRFAEDELNESKLNTDQQLVYALQRAKQKLGETVKNIQGGYAEDAKTNYKKQGGISLDVPTQSEIRTKVINGKPVQFQKNANGQWQQL